MGLLSSPPFSLSRDRMPVPTKQQFEFVPFENYHTGGKLYNCDINNLDEDSFLELQDLIYRQKVLVIKNQKDLIPAKQQELAFRFDPTSPSVVGHMQDVASKKTILGSLTKGSRPTLPGAFLVNVNGNGTVPAGHMGIEHEFELKPLTHQGWHLNEMSDEDIEAGKSRFQRFHIDYPASGTKWPARVTTIWAHTLPKGPDVEIQWGDGSDYKMMAAPGRTAFFDCAKMYEQLPAEQKKWVDHSSVEYARSSYEWLGGAKCSSNGLRIANEGKELAQEDLTDDTPPQITPMLWINPVTGEKCLQVHAIIVRKIHYKESADGPMTIIDDLKTVRQMLDDIQSPFVKPENIFIAPAEEGDLLMFANRLVRHSAVEHPRRYDRRLHQIQLIGSDPPFDPVKFPSPVSATA